MVPVPSRKCFTPASEADLLLRRKFPGPAARNSPGWRGAHPVALRFSEAEELAETLKALASPARLRLLVELVDGERTVERLADAASLTPGATSHHQGWPCLASAQWTLRD
jgi:regulatory ArsR family protein